MQTRIQPDGYNPTVNRLFNVPTGGENGSPAGRLAKISLSADSYHMKVNQKQDKCRSVHMKHAIISQIILMYR